MAAMNTGLNYRRGLLVLALLICAACDAATATGLSGRVVKIADGAEFKMPATIDDPAILDEITAALKDIGYPVS